MQRISARFTTSLVGAIVVVPIMACVCILSLYFYALTPFPTPIPYPNSTPQRIETAVGAGYRYETFAYAVPTSLDKVKKHYEAEMQRYCVYGWQFLSCNNSTSCLSAECLINRPFPTTVQSFTLQLRSSQVTETEVIYTQIQLTP